MALAAQKTEVGLRACGGRLRAGLLCLEVDLRILFVWLEVLCGLLVGGLLRVRGQRQADCTAVALRTTAGGGE